jgi:hypothetical protein
MHRKRDVAMLNSILRLYSIIYDRRLNNNSFIAHAASDALLVEVFE